MLQWTLPTVATALTGGQLRSRNTVSGFLCHVRLVYSRNIYFLVKNEDEGVWNAGTIISDGTASIVSFAEDNEVRTAFELIVPRGAVPLTVSFHLCQEEIMHYPYARRCLHGGLLGNSVLCVL